jgi:hypothetical protein
MTRAAEHGELRNRMLCNDRGQRLPDWQSSESSLVVVWHLQSVAPVKPDYGAWGRHHVWQTWRRCEWLQGLGFRVQGLAAAHSNTMHRACCAVMSSRPAEFCCCCCCASRYFRMRWVTPRRPFLAKDRHYMFLHFPHGRWRLLPGQQFAGVRDVSTPRCAGRLLLAALCAKCL